MTYRGPREHKYRNPGNPNLDAINAADRAKEEAAELASAMFAKALRLNRGPDTFQWDATHGNTSAGYLRGNSNVSDRYPDAHDREARAFKLRQHRDPCPSCATRADMHHEYGCGRVWG